MPLIEVRYKSQQSGKARGQGRGVGVSEKPHVPTRAYWSVHTRQAGDKRIAPEPL